MSDFLPALPEDPREIAKRAQRLIEDFLKGRPADTERTYRESLRQLADFAGVRDPNELVAVLGRSMGAANDLVMRWKNDMIERKLAPATINQRLTAARSLVRRMRVVGLVPWTLEVKGVRSRPYRDTSGPPLEVVRKFLATAAKSSRAEVAARDVAILRCLFDQALRRHEVAGLDVDHVDLEASALWIMPKGLQERVPVYLSVAARAAIEAWLRERRAFPPGRLFLALSRRHIGRPLGKAGINKLVKRLSAKVGHRATPHGFRHAAITAALAVGRSPREVQLGLARHSRLETTMIYDDNQKKLSRDLAESVSRALEGG